MMSVEMKKVHELAENYDKTLEANDKRFCRTVKIVDEDGTVLFYEYAFLLKHVSEKQTWIMVFTEHHDFYIFDKSCLLLYAQYGEKCAVESFIS